MSFGDFQTDKIRFASKKELLDVASPGPIAWEVHPPMHMKPSDDVQNRSKVYGTNLPSWMIEPITYQAQRLYATRFDNAFFYPEWGVVFPEAGVVFPESAHAARYKSPDLSQLSGFHEGNDSWNFSIFDGSQDYHRGTYLILNHWGSKNFGHFIFDSIPGVVLFLSEIMRGQVKIISPPLSTWQWAFLDRLGISRSFVLEVASDSCRCEHLIYPSTLRDNLNFPSPLTRTAMEYLRFSGNGQHNGLVHKRIYLTRRNFDNRQTVNEEDLTKELRALGFVEICPENFSVDEQIQIFSGAEIIVGEIGAALSNAAFTSVNCHIIEIMPEIKPSVWIRNLSVLLGFHWSCVYAPVPAERRNISIIDGVSYDNLIFTYEIPIDHVVSAVQAAISE